MALADPQSVTINAVATPLPRITSQGSEATYATADGAAKLRVSHTNGRNGSSRHLIRLEQKKVATDPLVSVTQEVTGSVHVVIDMPKFGFTQTDKLELVKALNAYLAAGTYANVIKILGNES